MLEYLEKVNHPGTSADYVVILLHGLGADCNDFVPFVSELKLSKTVKFIFPNAPMMPVTLNNGFVMRAWYDIKDLNRGTDHFIDNHGIDNSVSAINKIIEHVIDSGVAADKIILAGFSQGGVISYTAGISSRHKLGGILAMSCYLPNADKLASHHLVNKDTLILAIHGKNDHVVPYDAGLDAYNILKSAGFNISWLEYAMEHNVCAEEINAIHSWLENIFKA